MPKFLSNIQDADRIDDSSSTKKLVTQTEKNTWNGKQNELVSGTNIKTVNNNNLLGSGNVSVGTVTNVSAGNGMTFTAITGSGAVTMGTPGTLTTSTTNSVTSDSHTHAVTFPVTSVAGKTGAVTLAAGDITSGTFNVDRIPTLNFNKVDFANQNLNTTNSPTFEAITTRRFMQNANGVPTNNLGAPTVTEMALFEEQFDNKTSFFDISNIVFETFNGTTWTDITSSITDTFRKRLVGGTIDSNISIPNGTVKYRITLRAVSYVYLNALYFYWSGSGNSTTVHVWKKHDNGVWEQHTSSAATVSSWPGHLYLPFSTIPWNPTATQGTHWHEVRVEFTPTWSHATNPIVLYRMQWWGGYPSGRRTIYSVDENKVVTFPSALNASGQAVVLNNDSRLSDSRTPLAHTQAWSTITSTPTTLSGYGISDATPSSHVGSTGSAHGVATTSVNGFMSSTDKSKLDGIATGATANTGTVTSVSASAGTGISIAGSPITTSGTLTITNTAPNVTTNITTTHNASTVVVNSSDGTNGTINGATTSLAGVMTSADKTKLDGIPTGVTFWHDGNLTPSNYLEKTGGSLTGALTIENNQELRLRASVGSTDAGDIVWLEGDGSEQHRLWGSTGLGSTLNYRHKGGATRQLWHDGNLDPYYLYRNTGKTIASIDATASSSNAWNVLSNDNLKLTNNNNSLAFLVGGTLNDRSAIIQVGHESSSFANVLGALYLNKFGGNVFIGENIAYHAGNVATLTAGNGLNGSSYNASTAITWSIGAGTGITVGTTTVGLTNIASGSGTVGALSYNGTTGSSGRFSGGTGWINSSGETTRLNYSGLFYPTGLRWGINGSSAASDLRLKTEIESIQDNFILRLNPVQFKYREGSDQLQYGLIAQEVEEIAPENAALVKKPNIEDEYYGVDYTQLIAPMIATIQNLEKRIKELENSQIK